MQNQTVHSQLYDNRRAQARLLFKLESQNLSVSLIRVQKKIGRSQLHLQSKLLKNRLEKISSHVQSDMRKATKHISTQKQLEIYNNDSTRNTMYLQNPDLYLCTHKQHLPRILLFVWRIKQYRYVREILLAQEPLQKHAPRFWGIRRFNISEVAGILRINRVTESGNLFRSTIRKMRLLCNQSLQFANINQNQPPRYSPNQQKIKYLINNS